jgi:tetratricopeptide (TPR) repeat protein
MAWGRLALTFFMKTQYGSLAATEGNERARQLAQHALQLSPNSADAHAVLQFIYLTYDWDWAAAETEGQRALAIEPTNSRALQATGHLSRALGRWDDAERQFRLALTRDPRNPYVIFGLGCTYNDAGRFAEAEAMHRKVLELAPGFLGAQGLGKALLAQGKAEAALAVVQQDVDEAERLAFLPIALQAAGRKAEADEALKAQIAQWADTGAYFVAMTYAYRGDHDRALQWLERAYEQKDTELVFIVGNSLFKPMADDPRFKAFLRKMKLPV